MCFYDQKVFSCGDVRWWHFRKHCPAERRNGETCGLKLVMSSIYFRRKCDLCKRLKVKISRFWKEEEKIVRWRTADQGQNSSKPDITISRTASIGVSEKKLEDLRQEILKLQNRRPYPFSNLNCETGLKSEIECGDVEVDNRLENTLPTLKIFAVCHNSLPIADEEDEPFASEANMFMLQLLQSESSRDVREQKEGEFTDDVLMNDLDQDRLAFMLTVRLLNTAYKSSISSDGTICLPSGNMLSTIRYPGLGFRIFDYIQGLKTDLLHAGLSAQLPEAEDFENWLPRILKVLEAPDTVIEHEPRQMQRLLATLSEVQSRLQRIGFCRVHNIQFIDELNLPANNNDQEQSRAPKS